MDHAVAIEVLHDELEESERQAAHLDRGIASMTARRLLFSESIRKDQLLRWNRALIVQREKSESLRKTIEFLKESSSQPVYGFRQKSGRVHAFDITGLTYTQARDICETGAVQLMKQNDDGTWEEA